MTDTPWNPLDHAGHYLSRIGRGLTRIGDARLRPLGLATAQLPVLSMLQNGERRTQKELATLAKVEQPTMAQLLSRMERDGLVRREADPDDRRSSLVSLTDLALERLPAGREVLRQGNADMTRGLTAEEKKTLIALLQRVLENVEAL
ncbi:MarR family winged helix-turn-helix transcriptional regulator [Asaia krungthepensis]|uniref:MarR family transcriptional regulator n=1 Tax=Asaia krungthepensis NRIC 0535 TaxID=1307925 RepID=A0ABQ0Q3C1_9PROT|nr:MarR family transcriptional regulator [Asaia krungthepensis]GBQ89419.1 MarR family transcriptional regulator [Asaia krungthepensis NRIC 0535]